MGRWRLGEAIFPPPLFFPPHLPVSMSTSGRALATQLVLLLTIFLVFVQLGSRIIAGGANVINDLNFMWRFLYIGCLF